MRARLRLRAAMQERPADRGEPSLSASLATATLIHDPRIPPHYLQDAGRFLTRNSSVTESAVTTSSDSDDDASPVPRRRRRCPLCNGLEHAVLHNSKRHQDLTTL